MKLLNEILGTKYPIIQGGMANIATGEFAAACSNAGALGYELLTLDAKSNDKSFSKVLKSKPSVVP